MKERQRKMLSSAQDGSVPQSKAGQLKQSVKYATSQPKIQTSSQVLKANRSKESMLQNLLLPESEQAKNRSLLTKIQKQLAIALD